MKRPLSGLLEATVKHGEYACNCAECGTELLSKYRKGEWVTGDPRYWIKGRPYCSACCMFLTPGKGKPGRWREEPPPSWDNIVRMLEG